MTQSVIVPPLARGVREQPVMVAPSILSSDFAQLAVECTRVLEKGAEWLHVDVMDGHFVPNLTLGAPIVSSLRKHSQGFFDCHLMVSKPEQWVTDFAKAGANNFTFHIEATESPLELIKQIRAAGMKVGIALKPGTSADAVLPYGNLVDLLLVMTVEPGFGGQSFRADQVSKISTLRKVFPNVLIEVDGGINAQTAKQCADAGANVFVAGSAIFGQPDEKAVIDAIREAGVSGQEKW